MAKQQNEKPFIYDYAQGGLAMPGATMTLVNSSIPSISYNAGAIVGGLANA